MNTLFVVNGFNSTLPCAIFSTKEKAEEWVKMNDIKGTITEMPIDISAYHQAIRDGLFAPRNEKEKSAFFIATFSSRLWHEHYGRYGGKEVSEQ